ncbi:MAG: twin-arginine translocase subunit TatC, partial [Candidatus Omnitrophica bacterium]|nr:twin-arginine translocase subunit TatC [Candidatus Omnitrophota bacterium]
KAGGLLLLAWLLIYPSSGALLARLSQPAGKLVFLAPAEAFIAQVQVSFWGAVLVALPYLLYQVWQFTAAGLFPTEQRAIVLILPAAYGLFLSGAVFAVGVVMPAMVKFFLAFASATLTPVLSVERYVSFAAGLMLSFGLSFQLPLILWVLARAGIVSPALLGTARRYVIVLIFIVAAALTPPDVVSQLLLALPLCVLYEAGVWAARCAGSRRRAAPAPREQTGRPA